MLAAPDLPAAACPTRPMGRVPTTDRSGSCCRAGAGRRRTSPTGRAGGHELAFDLHLLSETRCSWGEGRSLWPTGWSVPRLPCPLLNTPNPHLDALPCPPLGARSPHPPGRPTHPWGMAVSHPRNLCGHRPADQALGLSVREADTAPRPVQLSHRTWDPHREGPAGAGQVTARVTSAPGAETYTFCSGAANTGVVSHVIAAGTPGGPGSVLGGEPGEQEEQVLGSKASPRSGLGKGLGAPGSFPPSADPCGHLRAHRPHKAVPMRCGARCAPSEHTGPTSCTLPPHCASGETPGPDSQRG